VSTESKNKVKEALDLLDKLGIPLLTTDRRRERTALALLAVGHLAPSDPWTSMRSEEDGMGVALKTRDIIDFWNKHYGENLSRGSYDDVRRKDLQPLTQSGLVLSTGVQMATNNPTRAYVVSEDAAAVARSYGTPELGAAVADYVKVHGTYADRLKRPRVTNTIEVIYAEQALAVLDDSDHNRLQKAIIEKFLGRFGHGAKLLYLGDTSHKQLYVDSEGLVAVGLSEPSHDKLPDVVAYSPSKNWLFFIEAVHSANPVSPERYIDLAQVAKGSTAPVVYVSVFADRAALRSWVTQIAWETEVWLADDPDHIIHFNGDRFMGPHI
jgi:hypothetical protein